MDRLSLQTIQVEEFLLSNVSFLAQVLANSSASNEAKQKVLEDAVFENITVLEVGFLEQIKVLRVLLSNHNSSSHLMIQKVNQSSESRYTELFSVLNLLNNTLKESFLNLTISAIERDRYFVGNFSHVHSLIETTSREISNVTDKMNGDMLDLRSHYDVEISNVLSSSQQALSHMNSSVLDSVNAVCDRTLGEMYVRMQYFNDSVNNEVSNILEKQLIQQKDLESVQLRLQDRMDTLVSQQSDIGNIQVLIFLYMI